MQQLPLPVQLRPESDFRDYLPGPNSEALLALRSWATHKEEPFIYLFGPPGSGKTHLLQAACRHAAAEGANAQYLPLAHPGMSLYALENLEQADAVALDDLQAIALSREWEYALFDLFNRLRERGGQLLVSADAPLGELALGLPDLRSRLGWGPAYRLIQLGDEDCRKLLCMSAERRGIALGDDVLDYLMRRFPRDAGHLLELLEQIDRECLKEKRRPSLWLVRRLLETR